MRARLDQVRGDFARHNLPLQALLGVLSLGERATAIAEGLAAAPPGPDDAAPGVHPLDLALLGLLGLHARMCDALEAPAPPPEPEDAAAPPDLPLRRLAR